MLDTERWLASSAICSVHRGLFSCCALSCPVLSCPRAQISRRRQRRRDEAGLTWLTRSGSMMMFHELPLGVVHWLPENTPVILGEGCCCCGVGAGKQPEGRAKGTATRRPDGAPRDTRVCSASTENETCERASAHANLHHMHSRSIYLPAEDALLTMTDGAGHKSQEVPPAP